ncbi:endonuclease domain-containing protein [Paenarthrobacter sp. NPDC056912]|uniref:endonuclease domain-containing protein n=1 Tax=Paenarthrobacter sp. NPDC056912 TaxID=3345965 RepID=UPI00366F34DB
MDALEFLRTVGGVARVGLLRGHGYTPAMVRRLVGAYQPRKGIWALPSADPEYLSALINNGHLTCASAAVRYGLWLKTKPTRVHVATRHNRGRGFVRHGGLRLGSEALLPLASVEDTVIHALTCLAEVDAIAVAQSAMTKFGVAREVLESELTAKYFGQARKRLAMADGLSESVPEISARLLFESEGLSFRRQVRIAGVGRVDILIDGWLIVEINGYQFHSSRSAWRKDMGRLNAAQVLGYHVLSYAPEQIWNSPEQVMAQIRALLKRRS